MGKRQGAVEAMAMNPSFWQGKRVFLTGHTGFKGSWLSLWLQQLGAHVTGFALTAPSQPSLFDTAQVGAGMTSIRLYSELAKGKVGENVVPEIDKISSSADELLNKMNAIIWSMSSQNDSLGNMVGYIRSYATDYLENTGIEHNIVIPESLPAIEVNGSIRRNVFLVIKEALQNIIKHSGAKKVDIVMKKEREGLSLTIHDDGKGINFDNIRPYSNGLNNMRKRMQDLDIEFSIENNNGTIIRLYRKTT